MLSKLISAIKKVVAFSLFALAAFITVLFLATLIFVLILSALAAKYWPDTFVGKWGLNILIGFDNFVSSVLLGDPDETISSRLGKAQRDNAPLKPVADLVDFVVLELFGQAQHCQKSIERDEGKDKLIDY